MPAGVAVHNERDGKITKLELMRMAVDTGGTFTDCVYSRAGELQVLKVPSTPLDPARALLEAVARIAPEAAEVRHGTTVGTNALLERKGARTVFVTTAGFEDTLAIGRQARPKLYDLLWQQEPPLIPAELCFGVAERVAADGTILQEIGAAELARLKQAVAAVRPESIALSLLFAFAHPANEQRAAAALRELGVPVSVSHEILPEFREYERASTLAINAYLAPLMEGYLGEIAHALESRSGRFSVMQSSGGMMSPGVAAREPVRTILSGPAGGVVGAAAVARAAGFERVLTFDMGGTSTDVALIAGRDGPGTTRDSVVLGMPVAIPTLDIHTVGAGGGSIAHFDAGGALRVGPESAGADPGPISYGRGERPTVTDANLLLGRFDPGRRLAGAVPLDRLRAYEYFAREKGSLASVEEFAEGIVRVANAHMAKALRHISVERGHDPRECALVSFGGAGPLHAVALARALEIPRVVIPNFPGALSAYGIFVSPFVRDYSRTVMLQPADRTVQEHLQALEERARRDLLAENLSGTCTRSLDLRYAGQGYELEVPWSEQFQTEFHRVHERQYGFSDSSRPCEIVSVRVRTLAGGQAAEWRATRPAANEHGSELDARELYYEGRWRRARFFNREKLPSGTRISGPAVLVEYSATTFLPPESAAAVDEHGNLIVEAQV